MRATNIQDRMNIINKSLPSIRLLYGWSRDDLGKMLGVTRNTVNHMENQGVTMLQFHAVLNVILEEYTNGPHDACHETAAALYNEVWTGKEGWWKINSLVFSTDDFRRWLKTFYNARLGAKEIAKRVDEYLSTRQHFEHFYDEDEEAHE